VTALFLIAVLGIVRPEPAQQHVLPDDVPAVAARPKYVLTDDTVCVLDGKQVSYATLCKTRCEFVEITAEIVDGQARVTRIVARTVKED
jgi:hypothetical protein